MLTNIRVWPQGQSSPFQRRDSLFCRRFPTVVWTQRVVCVRVRVSVPRQLTVDVQQTIWHHAEPRISADQNLNRRTMVWNYSQEMRKGWSPPHRLQLPSRHVSHLQLAPVLIQQGCMGVVRSVPASPTEAQPAGHKQDFLMETSEESWTQQRWMQWIILQVKDVPSQHKEAEWSSANIICTLIKQTKNTLHRLEIHLHFLLFYVVVLKKCTSS